MDTPEEHKPGPVPPLLPCPFCGEPSRDTAVLTTRFRSSYLICGNCCAQGPQVDLPEWAVEGWNRRAGAERARTHLRTLLEGLGDVEDAEVARWSRPALEASLRHHRWLLGQVREAVAE